MHNVELTDDIMQQEIFGPVLPVIGFSDFEEVLSVIQSLPSHPLAAYIFSQDKRTQDFLIAIFKLVVWQLTIAFNI